MSTQSNPNPNAGLYKYDPSLPAAAIFAGLFIVTTVLHLFQLIRARTLFMIPLTVGGFCPCPILTFLAKGFQTNACHPQSK